MVLTVTSSYTRYNQILIFRHFHLVIKRKKQEDFCYPKRISREDRRSFLSVLHFGYLKIRGKWTSTRGAGAYQRFFKLKLPLLSMRRQNASLLTVEPLKALDNRKVVIKD